MREFTVDVTVAAVMVTTTPSRFQRDCRND
jgi:hypothetical protein